MQNPIKIVLASSSPSRLELLKRINISPDIILPADIDESPRKRELPQKTAERLAMEKASKVSGSFSEALLIGADSIVVCGRTALPKALTAEEVKYCLKKLSGRRHRVYTAVYMIKKTAGQIIHRSRLVQTKLKFKRLTDSEINYYSSLKEGLNKAGGYSIGGYGESFVSFISGSYSNVIGLPLQETGNMLHSLGIEPKLIN